MALTPEEEEEYRLIVQMQKEREFTMYGENLLREADTADALRPTTRVGQPDVDNRGFSGFRMFVGMVQDPVNNMIDLHNYFLDNPFTAASGLSVLPGLSFADKVLKAGQNALGMKETGLEFSKVDLVEDSPEGSFESITRSIGGFMIPYAGFAKGAMAVNAAAGFAPAAARSLAAGFATNMTAMDATESNLANILRDDFGVDNATLDFLATEEDDDLIVGRLKASVSNLPLDAAGEALIEGGVRVARAYRASRTLNSTNKAAFEAAKETIAVSRATKEKHITAAREAREAREAANAARHGKSVTVGSNEAVAAKSRIKPENVQNFDEFEQLIKQELGAIVDQKELEIAAREFLRHPHLVMERVGVDPAKMDFSAFSDPKQIRAMQSRLQGLVSDLAAKSGRSNILVPIRETMRTARVLAVQPWSLQRLNEATRLLPERMMAGQMVLGSHAHKLMDSATRALDNFKPGGGGKAYMEFLDDFRNHTIILGTLRGAGSEVGRALNTLRHDVSVTQQFKTLSDKAAAAADKANAVKTAKEAGEPIVKEGGSKIDLGSNEVIRFIENVREGVVSMTELKRIADAAGTNPSQAAKEMGFTLRELKNAEGIEKEFEELFKNITTDAGRLRFIRAVTDSKGDLASLSRMVDRKRSNGILSTVDEFIRDTTGAMFSMGTAMRNMLSGFSMMAIEGMVHGLSYAGLRGYSAISGSSEASVAARVAYMKAWATFHAPISSYREAFSNAINEVKQAGLQDLSVIADNVKLNEAASGMQKLSNKAFSNTNRTFLKPDHMSQRGFAVDADTVNRMVEGVDQIEIGSVGKMGLEWLIRTSGAAVNAAGAAYRMGNTAFVNAPDQLTGTIATRIGQHTAAVDIAAREAAEGMLEGKAASAYIKGRSIELAELADSGMLGRDPFNDGIADLLTAAGKQNAKSINFTDEFYSKTVQSLGSSINNLPIVGTLIMPFPRTPLRIMEKSLVDYTPLFLLKKTVREAWASGDPGARGEIAARTMLTLGLLSFAWEATSDGTIAKATDGALSLVGFDKGYKNSNRLMRDNYTLKIGDDVWEYNLLDPLGTVMGLMADIREFLDEREDDRQVVEAVDGEVAAIANWGQDMVEAAFWGIYRNVLSKAYLQSFEQVTKMSAAENPDAFSNQWKGLVASFGTRVVPGSGVQRQAEMVADPTIRQARGVMEGIRKAAFGSSSLPPKRDPVFGRPMEYTKGQRLVGYKGGPKRETPVVEEIARLGFTMTMPRWKQRGVQMNSEQMSRFLELRGHTIKVDGYTLEDAMEAVITSPGYDRLTDDARAEELKSLIRPYTRAATEQLIVEDDDFAKKALAAELHEQYKLEGRDYREMSEELERLSKELGITK